MPASREYLIRLSKRKDYAPHKSDFVNRQRAIILTGTYELVAPKSRLRWHVTDQERIKHNIVCRPGYSYRGHRRQTAKFMRKVEKNRLRQEKKSIELRARAQSYVY